MAHPRVMMRLLATAAPGLTGTPTALQMHRQVHVAVMFTGDEVVDDATQELGPGQIRDANDSPLFQ